MLATQEFVTIIVSYICLFVVVLIASFQIKFFSGGWWFYDWYHHYQRSIYFISNHDNIFQIFIDNMLPERPPLFNVCASFFLWIFGEQFYIYQVISCFFNTIVFFALILFLNIGKTKHYFLLIIFLICNPYFMQNATYTWTKLFTAFFVILSLWLLIKYIKVKNEKCFDLSVVMMSLGLLSHYLSVVYGFVLLMYLFFNRTFAKLKYYLIARVFMISTIILLPWVLWSVYMFGVSRTFINNGAVSDTIEINVISNLLKWCFNIFTTLVPMYFWDGFSPSNPEFAFTDDPIIVTRDYWFFHYQHNLMFGMGSVLWILVVHVAWKTVLSGNIHRLKEENFWIYLIPPVIFLGIIVHGKPCYFGLSQICLSPVVLLSLLWGFKLMSGLKKSTQSILIVGLLFDFIFGVVLHFHVQSYFDGSGSSILKKENNLVFLHDLL